MLSVHTSPLEQPGTGDAGGMNVYVVELSRRLAERGVAVEVFTRRTAGGQPDATGALPGPGMPDAGGAMPPGGPPVV